MFLFVFIPLQLLSLYSAMPGAVSCVCDACIHACHAIDRHLCRQIALSGRDALGHDVVVNWDTLSCVLAKCMRDWKSPESRCTDDSVHGLRIQLLDMIYEAHRGNACAYVALYCSHG